MRKQIVALCLGFMTIGIFAQKDELKNAEKAIKNEDFKGALTILNLWILWKTLWKINTKLNIIS